MLGKNSSMRGQVGDYLERYQELAEDDRQAVRNLLRKATYLELARLLSDKEIAPALDAVRAERPARTGGLLEPGLVALGILAVIALVAAACAILEW